jgi:hypothetical protein
MRSKNTIQEGLLISSLLLFLITQTGIASAGVNVWTSNGPEGGIIHALAIDPATPDTLYAGTLNGGGVVKSTNGGTNWYPVNTGLPNTSVYALAIDPATPDTLYAGTGGGVFKSTNGGTNWDPVNTGLTDTYVHALAVDPATPSTLYAGTYGGGVFDRTGTPFFPPFTVNPSGTGSGTVTGNWINCVWNGTSSSGTCCVDLAENTTVNLSAAFAGWVNGSGSASICSGTGTCSFTITEPSEVGAYFLIHQAREYRLIVSPSGTGSGTVTGNGINCFWNGTSSSGTCSVNIAENTAVNLSATAGRGSTFAGWVNGSGSASICSGTGTCSFTITEPSEVGSNFSISGPIYLPLIIHN